MKPGLPMVAALLGAACSGPIDPMGLPVDERGPFQVGYRSWEVAYQPPAVDGPRTIALSMWYPTEESEGYHPAYEDLFRDPDVYEDAAPAAPVHAGGYPVLVHSHGHRGFAGNSADLMGYFASHGWVAVAPSHTDNTLLEGEEYPTSHFFERPLDITAALDALDQVELPGPRRTGSVLMTGHSFGTYTTWAVAGAAYDAEEVRGRCEAGEVPSGRCTEEEIQVLLGGLRDPRVAATIPMAGGDRGWFGDDGYAAVDVPVFLMTGTEDDVGAAALFETASVVDLRWIDVEGGCHQLFGLGGCSEIGDAEGFAIVDTYALAFGRATVLGDDSRRVRGILDGSVPVSPRVRLRHDP